MDQAPAQDSSAPFEPNVLGQLPQRRCPWRRAGTCWWWLPRPCSGRVEEMWARLSMYTHQGPGTDVLLARTLSMCPAAPALPRLSLSFSTSGSQNRRQTSGLYLTSTLKNRINNSHFHWKCFSTYFVACHVVLVIYGLPITEAPAIFPSALNSTPGLL